MTTQRIYDFMGQRKLAAIASAVLIIISLASLVSKGLVLGLDFTGGTLIEVGFEQPVEIAPIRSRLTDSQFNDAVVVHFGTETDLLIKLQGAPAADLGDRVLSALRSSGEAVELRRIEFVGPQIGEELRDDGGLGMLAALAVVMLYVAIRFQYKFSIAAVAALIHDVIITLGFFSVLGIEFDLSVLAAVLAVIGYSLNDTIVVSDRIRENFRLLRVADPIAVINESLSQTLGRTVITSLTTLLVLFALFFFGGELIHNFAIALIVGVTVGTYSSIYIAANMLITLGICREDLMQTQKEGAAFDDGLP
ncbi:MAG: protein translocase subunit SecF [Gammaproteobacteria bacterium]|nr:MAG: protein translocase subunit SecF [Gammaproteobacteria bacterium]RLA49352.1 MAG: protein translocase subunit SecF [Gammaproteobacteria bacterium]